jgi:hypothetical protein
MTDEADKKIAALEQEVEALKAKSTPAPAPTDPRETERSIAEHIDRMHQMRERRMGLASNFHPDDLRAMEAACPTDLVRSIALRDARAPQGPAGSAIPSSQSVSNVRTGGSSTPGWSEPRPLGPPEGIRHVDAQCIADDVRQRAELKRKLGG